MGATRMGPGKMSAEQKGHTGKRSEVFRITRYLFKKEMPPAERQPE
jgi:hypothetical protein